MKKWTIVLISSGVLVILMILATGLGLLSIRSKLCPGSNPVVDIQEPAEDEEITVGTPFILQAVARDPDGVSRMEFWLDQELVSAHESPWENGITPLPAAADLPNVSAGRHELVVRAYDSQGNSGQASRLLEAAESAKVGNVKSYEVQDDDTLESIALAHGRTTEEIAEANPGLEGDELEAGTEISVPFPSPDGEGIDSDSVPSMVSSDEITPPPLTLPVEDALPAWPFRIRNLVDPITMPAGLLDLFFLETDRSYDDVFCYILTGNSPALRTEYLSPLGDNLWNISQWFSGEHALPIITDSGDLRLSVNCMGFIASPAGGTAHDLGTLHLEGPAAEYAGVLIDERAEGPDGWFRIQGHIDESGGASKSPLDEMITLTWLRRVAGEIPEIPAPHVMLRWGTWRCLDGDCPTASEVFDYYRIYFDGEIIDAMATSPEYHILWDTTGETGDCYHLHEVFIEGYPGIPGDSGPEPVRSNSVYFYGYCPPKWFHVVVSMKKFSFLDVYNLDNPPTHGSGGCGTDSPPSAEELESVEFAASNLENYGPGCYGGVNVNGNRIWDIRPLCPITAPWRIVFPDNPPMIDLGLPMDESLTITSTMWDYDVWTDSDVMCPGTITFSSDDLLQIYRSGSSHAASYAFCDRESACTATFEVSVELMDSPPSPVFIP